MLPDPGWRSWRAAMADALYGPAGFYLSPSTPKQHFRTAAHVSPLWYDAIAELATRVDLALGSPAEMTVVDLGAGGGELLGGLAERLPDRISLHGVDLAPRPADLATRIGWSSQQPANITGLLIAVEWLDVVPLNIVQRSSGGVKLVEVDAAGVERLGPAGNDAQLRWSDRWWPMHEAGDRAEIGLTRDAAWATATAGLTCGLAVAIDYAAAPARDTAGTFIGYRDGRACPPVPDGSCDLTAHVLFDSLLSDGDVLLTQREALDALGLRSNSPSYDGNPRKYLTALARAGEAAELSDRAGLGGFEWLLHPVGIESPLR